MNSSVTVQLNDRAQQYSVYQGGVEVGTLIFSLVHGLIDLQKLEMQSGYDTPQMRNRVIDAVMSELHQMEDTHIRASDPNVAAWMIENPDYFDLLA